ncbi:hypothetical protein [Microbacterium pumilum]|uniref:Uncharacterized protein n=1 Tax=Microbacterium pumilum TaxID=344165 RepID=A0ABN2S7W1_9MICO
MKRIDVVYDGHVYSVGQRDLDELRDLIAEGHAAGGMWLLVNEGEGTRRDAYLWIAPGTSIALVPIPGDADSAPVDEGPLGTYPSTT